jgi:arsenite methyltransferase
MIKLARRNAKKVGATNVDFRYGEMEEMPIPDASVDVIISNCVINLSPDKDAVFAEAFRVLKPGGRMSVSDIVTNGQLPEAIGGNAMAWAGCVAGALDEKVYLDKMRAAGLTDVAVTQRAYVNPESFLDAPDVQEALKEMDLPASAEWLCSQLNHKIASITVTARKPGE